jgi:hypothetical protein
LEKFNVVLANLFGIEYKRNQLQLALRNKLFPAAVPDEPWDLGSLLFLKELPVPKLKYQFPSGPCLRAHRSAALSGKNIQPEP